VSTIHAASGSGRAERKLGAAASEMGRFETEFLPTEGWVRDLVGDNVDRPLAPA
jgi:hypothetical protein